MILPGRIAEKEEVSPLELFFDLVFVFAVSQLSHHLLEHLTWRGVAETVVLLIAVYGVWSYTSFEATVLHVGRSRTQWVMLAVMALGFFMNAAIAHAFGASAWWFVAPLLIIQIGRPIVTIMTTPTRLLRVHYMVMLSWILVSAPLWIGGAIARPETRLRWWAVAAAIDLVGTWFAHPVPGRVLHSEHVEFDAEHMLERCRLFLIIALGESVITSGDAITEAPRSLMTIVTGLSALVAVVALWALYFSRSNQLVNRNLESTDDPIFAARTAINALLVTVAGLIALAVGSELVIAHPRAEASNELSLLLFCGSALYLLSQVYYLRFVIGIASIPRLAGIVGLAILGSISLALPPYVSLVLLAALLAVLALAVRRDAAENETA